MTLHRRTTQQQINLIIIIPKPPQILNTPQRRLPVRNRRVQIMLFPVFVDAEAFKVEVPSGTELGFHRTRDEDGGFHAELAHAVFDDIEFEGDAAGDFDGAAEGDFAVALCCI